MTIAFKASEVFGCYAGLSGIMLVGTLFFLRRYIVFAFKAICLFAYGWLALFAVGLYGKAFDPPIQYIPGMAMSAKIDFLAYILLPLAVIAVGFYGLWRFLDKFK